MAGGGGEVFGMLYREPNQVLKFLLGAEYEPPELFNRAEDTKVAHLPKDPEDGGGQPVVIYECRLPATFIRVDALQAPNSMGESQPAFSLSTGSGDEVVEWAVKTARLITQGMVGFKSIND